MPSVRINNLVLEDAHLAFLMKEMKETAKYLADGKQLKAESMRRYMCVHLHNINLALYWLGDDGPKDELPVPPDPKEVNPLFDEIMDAGSRVWKYKVDVNGTFDRNGIAIRKQNQRDKVYIDGVKLGPPLVDVIVQAVSNIFLRRADVDSWIYDLDNLDLAPYLPLLWSIRPSLKTAHEEWKTEKENKAKSDAT